VRKISKGVYVHEGFAIVSDCLCSRKGCSWRWTVRSIEKWDGQGWPVYDSEILDSASTLGELQGRLAAGTE
jgi:hypothetical protein